MSPATPADDADDEQESERELEPATGIRSMLIGTLRAKERRHGAPVQSLSRRVATL